jgi:hypothetical protein
MLLFVHNKTELWLTKLWTRIAACMFSVTYICKYSLRGRYLFFVPSPNCLYIHTYHSRFIPEDYFSQTPPFYQNCSAMRNTTDVTGSNTIAIWSQSISGVNAVIPLIAFYDIHGRKREVVFFYSVPDTTRDYNDIVYTLYSSVIICNPY